MTVLASVTDTEGRTVELTAERWGHIIARHPELSALQADVLRAVTDPDRTHTPERPGQLWYYLTGPGPSRWLRVPVAYEGQRGFILTAFPRGKFP